ncbi:amino acid adenylation domain-containing protein [Rhodococcus sp. PAM 2766]|uniref:Amino acid adenylation domain-containing protein n=1 Tax=Rhodococcus parequi TaxID=3137122 RepID=A0ABW9FLQ4_9NOCA
MRPFPLAPAQKALLVAQQLLPDIAMTVAEYLEVRGDIDSALFIEACDQAARDIGSGTVVLVEVDGDVLQTPVPDIDDRPHFLDLSDADDPHAAALDWMTERTTRPIDLFSDRLAEMTLIRLRDGLHYLHYFAHHIVMDGSAAQVLTDRISEVYAALVEGVEPPPTSTAPVEEVWRSVVAYNGTTREASDREYWKQRLVDLPPSVSIADRPGPVSTPALRSPGELPAGTLTGGSGAAMPDVPAIVAGFAAYLSRVLGVDDVVLSLPVSARTTALLRRSAGSVSNVVPLRVRVAPSDTVEDLVRRVQVEMTGALRHQRFRYEEMLRDLPDGEGRTGLGGVFGPIVNILQFPQTVEFGPVTGELFVLSTGPVEDLSLTVYPGGADRVTRVDFEANPSRYSADSLLRHHRRLLAFLAAFAASGAQLVSDVPFGLPGETTGLTPAEGRPVSTREVLLPDALARHAHSGGVAVRAAGEEITYAELDARSSALARRLISLGCGPEAAVAVLLPRSIDSVVALWAIAKSGAAYVPVDPTLPPLRLAQHLSLVRVAIGRDVEVPGDVLVVEPEAPGLSTAPVTDADRVRPLRADNPAWIIHTSGSTGRPKAVVVSHRGIAGLLATLRTGYTATPDSRVLHIASLSFDASIQEILTAADAGATLVIADSDVVAGDPLAQLIAAEGVTHVLSSPAVLAATPSDGVPALRMLDAGGEVLPVPVARRWAEHRTMVNAYGPTETTILAAVSDRIDPTMLAGAPSVPVGRPVDGSSIVVLDGRLRACPPGVVGEVYVLGSSLARGYAGEPASTAARFVASPFGEGRMYRTGDLARWSASGDLDIVGRVDHQIQLRGIRVEPGEVDAVLVTRRGVRAAATVAVHERLVTFVCGEGLRPDRLREWLAERLPAHAVPTEVVLLDALPLTASGKVDRAALADRAPTPDGVQGRRAHGVVEELVADAMHRILGVEVDASADFFDHGGNSLSASRLAARISAVTGRDVSVRDVFARRTATGLAAVVAGAAERPALYAAGDGSALPAPAQRRLWLQHRIDRTSTAYHVPFVLDLAGTLSEQALRDALRDVLRRHTQLRTVLAEGTDGEPRPRLVAPDDAVSFETVEFRNHAESHGLTDEFVSRPFDLGHDVPIRFALHRFDDRHHELLVVAHHIALDGLSFTPLITDLTAAYTARCAGEAPGWSPLPVDYADYARWQRDLLESGVRAGDLAYWQRALDGAAAVQRLPLDRSRPATPGRAERITVHLDSEVRAMLGGVARDIDATVFMVLHSAVAVLLSAVTGTSDTLVGTPESGRNDPLLEPLVGMFVGTVALRAQVDRDAAFTDLVTAVRHFDVEAFVHGTTPFDLVQEACGVVPLQAMLAYESFADPALAWPGLEVSGRPVPGTDARSDLEIAARETSDGLELGFVYDSAVLDRRSVQGWANLLETILGRVAADPNRRIADLVTGGAPDHGLAVTRTPITLSDIANGPTRVVDATGAARDITPEAESLARHLLALGVQCGEFVGVLLPRSVDAVTAVLAVARSGAAFVPIDPHQPAHRITTILADSGARFVIARADAGLPDGAHRIDPDTRRTTGRLAHGYFPTPHPDAPAYAIYTSGSSGLPKGVVVTHRGLGPLTTALRRSFGITERSRVLHAASPAFDASILEYLLVLGSGATLVVVPDGVHGPDGIADIVRAQRITHWFSTPAVPAQIAPDGLDGVRVLGLGGEAWSSDTAARWAPGRTLLNLYGPTESSIVATISRPIDGLSTPPIGVPVDGSVAAVLDAELRPVAVGAVGELYIAGPGLARGYLGRPALTAERFVASVLGPGRMYRTGDLVRRRTDGQYEFVARSDRQIQIRGFRVELGEVEAALTAHPDVDTAIAVEHDGAVAAFVHGRGHLDAGLLRGFAAGRLPRHMVPGVVTVLERVPLTVAGKIDRAALPVPVAPRPESGEFHTAGERAVARMMSEILGGDDALGRDSDFFVYGGNSLLATQLVSRVGATTGTRIEVRDVFENPTVAGLAAVLDRVTESPVPWQPSSSDEPAPLSPAQQRMWVVARRSPSAADNIAFVLEITGDLDTDALRTAVSDVLDRHEALRTVLRDVDGRPVQMVEHALPVPEVVEAPDGCADRVQELASRPIDITTAQPVRTALYRTGDTSHTLAVVAHHAVLDGLSVVPLYRDLAEAFRARRRGAEPDWAPVEIRYTDYARAQRQLLGDPSDPGSRAHDDLAYWTERLETAPQVLALPSDRSRDGESDSAAAGAVTFAIPAELHAAVEKVALEYDATPFMVVHAALVVLLARLSGTDDICVGTPVSGRSGPGLDQLVGMLVGTVVLRATVDPARSFVDLLGRIRRDDLDALSHAETPFDDVVAHVAPRTSRAHHPLFQVMLAYENFVPAELSLPGLDIRARELHSGMTRFDLEVTLRERDPEMGEAAGIDGVLTYARDLFDHETVSRWAAWLVRVLETVTDDPAVVIDAIDPAARGGVLGARPGAAAGDLPRGVGVGVTSLAELFVQRAAENPDAVAVVAGEERVTYRELDDRSRSLARRLGDAGVVAEDVVALALPRSVDLIVAMIAVVRSGAAYLPLDLAQPRERLDMLVEQAGATLVLHDGGFPGDRPSLVVGSTPGRSDLDRCGPVDVDVRGDQAAYVIYTSGSTGTPKGVTVSHANVLSLLANTFAGFGFGPSDVWTMFHSPAFDFSVWEIWGPLGTGGSIVVVDHFAARNPRELRELLVRERVSVLNQTPTAFGQLIDVAGDPDDLALRLLIFGGEALDVRRVAPWLGAHPAVRAVNMFGITETTVHTTWTEVAPDVAVDRSIIGAPLPGMRIDLLDRSLRPVLPGVIGEMYLSGPQVARGYRSRPGLTAGRFVAAEDGAIRYRTGDLARLRNDGTYEFRGRADDQLQVRGHRIEPGEIVRALRSDAGVVDAAVAVRGGRLVAYVVPGAAPTDRRPVTRTIVRSLRRVLPDYMIPAAVVVMDALPLTANGKVDAASLPGPEDTPTVPFVTAGAHTPFEAVVLDVWSGLLGVAAPGRDDDFFDIGGNSLLATQVAGRLTSTTGVEIGVRDVFEAATAADLARTLEDRVGRPRRRPELLTSTTSIDSGQLSPGQRRLWFQHLLDPGSDVYNLAFTVRFTGDLVVGALEEAVLDVLGRHRILRTTYSTGPDGPLQHVVGVPAVDLAPVAVPDGALTGFVLSLARRPFDLEAAPPLRFRLYRTADTEHVLAIVVHHIAADGWSLDPLLTDLAEAYSARVEGRRPRWSPLPLDYLDHARWQSTHADADLDHWMGVLDGAPAESSLPQDRIRSEMVSTEIGTVPVRLDGEPAERVAATGRRHRSTVFMTIHAALAAVLARHNGATDIVIGTAVAGRGDPRLDSLVGMFASTLPLRTDIAAGRTFADLLEHVRERDVEAFAHADTPFERIVERIAPERHSSRHPIFQVALTVRRPGESRFALPGLDVSAAPIEAASTQFDLHVTVTEGSGSLDFEFAYRSDLYESGTVEAFAARLVRFLDRVTLDPGLVIGDVDLLTGTEHSALVPASGGGGRVAGLWSLLATGAVGHLDRVAVVAGEHTVTYRELVDRSESLARELVSRGAGPGVPVTCAVARSLESVAAVWAIARTGAAPVMIDPDHPDARIRQMLSVSGARIGVATGERIDTLPSGIDWIDVAASGTADLVDPVTRPDDVAYVVFTSGTTGRPKAVALTARGLGAFGDDLGEVFGADAESSVLHVSGPGFDMALLEILLAGMSGARLVVAGEHAYGGPELAALMTGERVTHACLTPSVASSIGTGPFPDLAALMLGGERVSPNLVTRWGEGRRLYIGYGPAEATAFATWAGPLAPADRPLIGRPARGIDAVVLDRRMRPVPPGVTGELYLSGDRLAAGYAGGRARTAERFVATHGGRRHYRTGDLVRWIETPTGPMLDFRGRTDDQVKIRGVRVEPAEIDAVLRGLPGVQNAATVVREHGAGHALYSYVVPESCDPARLREGLVDRLPAPMVPTAILTTDSIPLTPNGKVDAARLPAPAFERTSAPTTPTEALVADAYAAALRTEVGRHDDFFAAGGDSLLATAVVSQLRARVEREVPLRLLFDEPTVAGLAAAIDAGRFATADGGPVAVSRPERLPLSGAQRRMWAQRRTGGADRYRLGALVELHGPLDRDALEAALADVVERHEILRTSYADDAAGPYAVIRPAEDTHGHGDAAPLRVVLRADGARSHTLDVEIDHLAADGASVAILVRDIATAYEARLGGTAPRWEPLPLQYIDYALWERDAAVRSRDVEFWRHALSGFDPAELPSAAAPGAEPGSVGAIEFAIGPDVAGRLSDLATARGATEFMVLHAALAATVSRLSGHADVGIAAVVSGRRYPQLASVVGPFVDTVVLRARVEAGMSFAGLLGQVRDFDVTALDRTAAPIEEVLRSAGLPTPQVALAFQDFTVPALRVGDLGIEARETDPAHADFDLRFTLWRNESGGLTGRLLHDVSRFGGPDAELLVRQFTAVVDAVAASPESTVGGLPLFTAPVEVAEPACAPVTLASMLRVAAATHPDRVAVIDGENRLTYRELDEQSDESARRMVDDGIGPDDVVAITSARSIERLRQLWAVTKAGAAFGPEDIRSGLRAELDSAAAVDTLAYVITTSGSTGIPKRVAVTHRGLAALAAEARHRYRVGPGDRVLHGYDPAFDAAVLEILLAHTSGATLVVAPPDVFAGAPLHDLLRRRRISHFLSTPAVLATMQPGGLDDLRVVASGGESLAPETARVWCDGRRMLDAYGPTESTVVALLAEIGADAGLGEPIPGTGVLVLDSALRPVPVGGVGEIYLTGAGLARGYLDAPGATSARFVASVCGPGRMYRTGDRVQVRADGRLRFLGRVDRQLKIRGARVEPAQVESALLQDGRISRAAVTAVDGALVAFVCGAGIDPVAVLRVAARSLPPTSVPSRVHVLEQIPTTSNGKTDYRSLTALARGLADTSSSRPLSATEAVVGATVADVLGHTVDIDAGFFAVGGHSLAAVEVAGRLAALLGRDVAPRAVLEAPTLAALCRILDTAAGTDRPGLVRTETEPVPIAPAQRRLWLLHRADPDSVDYVLPIVTRLGRSLDPDALAAAVCDVVHRHEVLRTYYPDETRQIVTEPGEFAVRIVRNRLPRHEIDRRIGEMTARPADVTAEAPMRAALLRTDEDEWILVAVTHHIAVDGASVAPLLRDVAHAYSARVAGVAPEWDPLPLRYRDFAHWQVRLLGALDDPDSVGGRQLAYWSRVLAGAPRGPLALPADRPRPAVPTHSGGVVHAVVGPELHAALADVARAQGVTVFMVLHAALAALLARYGSREDITVGTVVSGRPDARLDSVVGMFVGTLALRTAVDPAESFGEFLRRVREIDLGAFAHADVPFDDVVARVAPERNPAHHPLFQVLLAHSTAVPAVPGLPGVDIVDDLAAAAPPAQFDLVWDTTERGDGHGINLRVVYAADLFDPATVDGLAAAWIGLLEQAVADVSTAVGDLALPEHPPLVADTAPPARRLDEILAETVRQHPDRVALRGNGDRWTYAELAAAAKDRSEELRLLGVRAGDIVPVDAVRGPRWVVEVWALTRLGAAWVPIDPAYPPQRRRALLDGAATGSGDGLAYLLFTSGSTGVPKGVAVTHDGLVTLVDLQERVLGVTPESVVLQAATPTFDASVFELLAAHAHGATLICAPESTYAGSDLQQLIEHEGVTHVNLTPTVLSTLDPGAFTRSLTVVSAGETLPQRVAAAWAGHRLYNGYGPTECTVGATLGAVAGDSAVGIGLPMAGKTVRVLDARLRPVPAGVVGELYVGGAGLARGYHGAPGTTAGRFVADPFDPGARLFRTGDLARVRADGAVEYVGREDDQVQINGVRVEPSEIDAVLAALAPIRASVTVPIRRAAGERTLVSYVVARAGATVDAARVRADLARVLPRHLVPIAVVDVEQIPTTPGGKVDRAALPTPDLDHPGDVDDETQPEGPVERAVAAAMADVLGRSSVPRDRSFFELGGTSLGVVRLTARLREDHGYDVALRELLADPTVAAIADRVVAGGGETDPLGTVVALNDPANTTAPPLFCVHPVSGLAWCYAGLAESVGARPLYGLQATGEDRLPGGIGELAARYVDHVRRIQPHGPYHLLGWSLGGNIAHEMAVRLRDLGEDVASLSILDAMPATAVPDAAPRDDVPIAETPDGLDARTVEKVLRTGEALEAIAYLHRPRIFDGDVTLFVAAQEPDSRPALGGLWEPYVAGSITEHLVDCTHAEMGSADVLGRVAGLLESTTGGEP